MSWLQKGDKFLSEISKQKLKELYKKEKKTKPKLRLLAAILRKEGKTLDDIAYSIQKPKTTVHDWLQRLNDGSLKNLHDVKQTGRPPRLSKKEKKELKKILSESPEKQNIPFVIWTTSLIQYVTHKLFNVLYKIRNIEYLVKEFDFSLQKPRQEHKKANKKAQEKFKKNLEKKLGIILNLDSRSFVLMKPISK